ncbi:hypothetical protein [Actinomycetospora atypica]|uniref:Uncharacterized protein n=1 Tax=Actinomycetospora atypica TaxID=1290095 RepID=A0ABV9YQ21_9PSEU
MPTPGHPSRERPPPAPAPPDRAGPTTALDAPTVRHAAVPTSPPAPPARGGGLSTVRVTGQALAATTTAAAGGLLGGAAGTVAGAAVASMVTTVGEALYQRSLERTRDHVRTRIDARRPRPTVPPPPDEAPTRVLGAAGAPAGSSFPRARIAVLVATAIVIFLIAMVVVTGIERVKGSPLSGGPAGTSVGEVFGTAAPTTTTTEPDPDDDEPGAAATTTTSAPDATTSAAPTTSSRSRTTTPTTTLVPTGN